MRKQHRLSIVAVALLAARPGYAGTNDIVQGSDAYTVTSWGYKDGLPSGGVHGLAQDSDGYLWLGTNSGLLRFDGISFVSWDSLGRAPLPRRPIRHVLHDRDGSLWLGFAGLGGVVHIQDGRVEQYGASAGLQDGDITALVQDIDGVIWAANVQGLFRLAGTRWKRVGQAEGLPDGPIFSALADPQGRLFVGTASVVLMRADNGGRFEPVHSADDRVMGLAEDAAGTLYLTDPTSGVKRVGAPPQRAAVRGRGYVLLRDSHGAIWTGTMGQGLWRVAADREPAQRASVDEGNGVEILGDWVLGLLEDRAGNIWAGTYEGLNKLTKARMTGIPSVRTASAIDLTPAGHVWVGTAESLIRFAPDRDRWQMVERVPVSGLRALHVNERGTVWVATPGGLFQVSNGRLVPVCSSEREESLGHITSIASDSQGGVWLYSRGLGPFRWNDGRLQALPWTPDFDAVPAVSAYTDRHGWVWFTSGHRGVRVIVPGKPEVLTYTAKDGLDEDDYGLLYEDSHANIWLGGRGVLSRFRNGGFQTVTARDGFPEEIIRSIIEDDRGTLWLGTGSGIVRMEPSEFDRAIENRGHQIRYSLYDVADGVYGLPVFHGSRNAVKTADGRLWFVTAKGLTIVDPRLVGAAAPPAMVSIEAVIADGRRHNFGQSVVLPSRTDAIDISYSALDLTAPQKIRFRYFLENFDKGWLDGNSEHVARYTNLPAGHYRFRVTADNGERSAAPLEAALPFTIAPVFYRTTWFYAALSLTMAGALWTAWRVRSWQIHQRYAAIVDERARLGRAIHDTLLQSLIGIAWQCDVIASDVDAAAPGLGARLVQMRDLVERHVREVRHSIWELRSPTLERRDLAAALAELAESAASGSGVELVFETRGTPRRCDDTVEEQLLRIGQEAVCNAIRHAKPTQIRVELVYLSDAIRLAVSDDGQGFNAEFAQQPTSRHFGLSFMRERAENVGGTLAIGSQFGRGTDVEAIIPTTTH